MNTVTGCSYSPFCLHIYLQGSQVTRLDGNIQLLLWKLWPQGIVGQNYLLPFMRDTPVCTMLKAIEKKKVPKSLSSVVADTKTLLGCFTSLRNIFRQDWSTGPSNSGEERKTKWTLFTQSDSCFLHDSKCKKNSPNGADLPSQNFHYVVRLGTLVFILFFCLHLSPVCTVFNQIFYFPHKKSVTASCCNFKQCLLACSLISES